MAQIVITGALYKPASFAQDIDLNISQKLAPGPRIIRINELAGITDGLRDSVEIGIRFQM